MTDELDRTIRLQRGGKIGTDSLGRTVWTKPVETVELELVSTQMLETILDTADEAQKQQIRDLAGGDAGVLARNTASRGYEIVRDDELESALRAMNDDKPPQAAGGFALERAEEAVDDASEELSLVTTQVLRKILEPESTNGDEIESGGHNPYDRG